MTTMTPATQNPARSFFSNPCHKDLRRKLSMSIFAIMSAFVYSDKPISDGFYLELFDAHENHSIPPFHWPLQNQLTQNILAIGACMLSLGLMLAFTYMNYTHFLEKKEAQDLNGGQNEATSRLTRTSMLFGAAAKAIPPGIGIGLLLKTIIDLIQFHQLIHPQLSIGSFIAMLFASISIYSTTSAQFSLLSIKTESGIFKDFFANRKLKDGLGLGYALGNTALYFVGTRKLIQAANYSSQPHAELWTIMGFAPLYLNLLFTNKVAMSDRIGRFFNESQGIANNQTPPKLLANSIYYGFSQYPKGAAIATTKVLFTTLSLAQLCLIGNTDASLSLKLLAWGASLLFIGPCVFMGEIVQYSIRDDNTRASYTKIGSSPQV